MSRAESGEKGRLLRMLAFHIHKKLPADEALTTCIEAEGRGGRHRQWRQAGSVLAVEGFVPALVAAGLVGDEAALVLSVLHAAGDHRLLSKALENLAAYREAAD